jgi:2-methylisocitrate lyase-like PEP mutase family enzyme
MPGETTTGAKRLRELLAGDELIVAPGIYDGVSAALVSRLGFPAAYMTGAGVVASAYGLPDIGLATLSEMAERARILAGLLTIPLIADADTGYGSPINVVRTVREYERAGVAAIQLEDQAFPKRCGHLAGKEVVAADEFELTLQAALDARRDPETVIIARTDARAPLGLGEAIDRGRRYSAAGADVIFVEAPQSEDEIERIANAIEAPKLINLVPGGRTPALDHGRLTELGFRIAIHPITVLLATMPAAVEALRGLLPTRSATDAVNASGPEELFELFGLGEWQALGRRYDGGASG